MVGFWFFPLSVIISFHFSPRSYLPLVPFLIASPKVSILDPLSSLLSLIRLYGKALFAGLLGSVFPLLLDPKGHHSAVYLCKYPKAL